MRIEERLAEAMRAAVRDEPPLVDAWEGYQARSRRWRMGRIVLAGATATAVMASVAVAVPRLVRDPEPEVFQPPKPAVSITAEPTPTPSPAEPAGLHYTDKRIGFELWYPEGWTETRFEPLGRDFVAFVSPGEAKGARYHSWENHAPGCTECPVAVAVNLVNFAEHQEYVRLMRTIVDKWKRQGVEVAERTVWVAGLRTLVFGVAWPDRVSPDPQDQEWCRGCRGDWYLLPWREKTTLDVRVMAMSAGAYERDGARGLQTVASMRRLGAGGSLHPRVEIEPSPTPTPTRSKGPVYGRDCEIIGTGALPSDMLCDAYTETVMRFADRRIRGSGAEPWLSVTAAYRYETQEGGLWLYPPEGEDPFISYFITEREDLPEGGVRFTLEMNQGFVGDGPDRITTERLLVGTGSNSNDEETSTGRVVKFPEFVSRTGDPTPSPSPSA